MEEWRGARPIQEQRLERALNLDSFLDTIDDVISQPSSDSDDDSDDEPKSDFLHKGLLATREERCSDRARLYNLDSIKKKRQWLKEILLSSSDSDSDEELNEDDLQDMIREHKIKRKFQSQFYMEEESRCFMYYGSGLLSRSDHYPDHIKSLAGSKRKKNKGNKRERKDREEVEEKDLDETPQGSPSSPDHLSPTDSVGRSKSHRRREKKNRKLDAQALAIRRHKLWVYMAKKEVGRCQKSKVAVRKDALQNSKKLANSCMRYCRQKALQSQRNVKDKVWLMKRLTRTMQTEWKRFDKIIKEQNKRAEKEAEEQRKVDKEIVEAKRQQRKVNFLITLPELYSHFMKNKLSGLMTENDSRTNDILNQLEDDGLTTIPGDDYDSEAMKNQALQAVQTACSLQKNDTKVITSDTNSNISSGKLDDYIDMGLGSNRKDHGQPSIFCGQLKSYQLKGMNWLANLYYFGINGILADEMGLGKTVQSVAFLAHICEEYDTWGPFLIVTPASTLHNWTCEINRFVPLFKVVPYWGNPEERKNLRKFFDGKSIGSRETSFHILVTSYQIVIQDLKYLNRVKWNYMVLDEAQAIKSINSQRWKQLLGFSCRNRLLLSGTPIQNSMAELWALLHFIMPTLFDSHLWFNEWFSKDIEGHAENKTHVDEKHLNRLHMILKPFMLRRIKSEVENELSDKIEIMMYCPLTLRQKYLYNGLKNKISIDELLCSSMSQQALQAVSTSLMNLVMQFRKVCNHPELLERREVMSPFCFIPESYILPKLLYLQCRGLFSNSHILYNKLSIFNPSWIHQSLKKNKPKSFSFVKYIDMSVADVSRYALEGFLTRWLFVAYFLKRAYVRSLSTIFPRNSFRSASTFGQDFFLLYENPVNFVNRNCESHIPPFIFTDACSSLYTFQQHIIHFTPETSNHRTMRWQKLKRKIKIEDLNVPDDELPLVLNNGDSDSSLTDIKPKFRGSGELIPADNAKTSRAPLNNEILLNQFKKDFDESSQDVLEFPFVERNPIVKECQATFLPSFLLHTCPKVRSLPKEEYCYDRGHAFMRTDHNRCGSINSLNQILYGTNALCSDWKMRNTLIYPPLSGGLYAVTPIQGWNYIVIPDKHSLIMDAGKLYVLDTLLSRLKAGNHRVLIYSQMTKMIDLLEEYMWHRKHKYMRLDGSSKISDRRDMVEDFQNKSDIFVFLLSTRAGGVGINLTAADTVIFYDSDWNPTVDQQAMDRAHRLGQTKQVTVYRLICRATIEERMLARAQEKREIQQMVISGGNFKPDTLKPKEVVSLLLDDDIEKQYRARQLDKRQMEDQKHELNKEKMRERMRKRYAEKKLNREALEKRRRLEEDCEIIDVCGDDGVISQPGSPLSESSQSGMNTSLMDDASSDALQIADVDVSVDAISPGPAFQIPESVPDTTGSSIWEQNLSVSTPSRRRRRGRPRGSTSRARAAKVGIESSSGQNMVNGSLGASDASGPVVNGDSSSQSLQCGGLSSKRSRGRPRLLPVGPGNQGTRGPQGPRLTPQASLPAALGSSLVSSQEGNTQNYNEYNS